MPLDFNELRQLLVTIAQTDIAELTLKSDDFELTVRKALGVGDQLLPGVTAPSSGIVGSQLSAPPPATQLPLATEEPKGVIDISRNAVQSPSASTPSDPRLVEVISPMVGTFYRAPAPSEPPFVEVGDRISVGQTVCIIEAMKLMNEIEAEVSGQIMEVLVQNGEPVEYGQPLLRINPS